jgi:four helix bundle protein
MQSFQDLDIWRKGHQLVLNLYPATRAFPTEELYGLTSQIRRAVLSIPTNIAEGCGREGKAELARFTQIAMGSAFELEYHLLVARDLGYLDPTLYNKFNQELLILKRMMNKFLQTLRSNRKKPTTNN